MSNQALSVDFGLNIDWNSFNSAVNSVNKLDKQVAKLVSGAEAIAGVFAAGGVAGALFNWAEGAVQKYAEMEKATTAFGHAMQNLGITSQSAIRDYVAYAVALSRCSMATKEQILESERLLATFGLSGESLKRATKAALDLSAGLGVDLRTATLMLGKAFDGNTASLSRLGIHIAENTPKSQVFAEVMRQVEARFGGSAAAEMDTYAGKLNLLHKQFQELTETFGRALMPVAVEVLNWFKDLGTVLEWLLPKLGMYQNEDEKLRAHLERELKIAESFLGQWERILTDREGKGGWLSRLIVGHGEEGINAAKEMVAKYAAEIEKIKAQLSAIGKSTGGSTVPNRKTGATDKVADDTAAWKQYVAAARTAYQTVDAMVRTSTEFEKLLLTDQGKNYLSFYGAANILDRQFAAQRGANAQEVERNTQLALAQLKADYEAAGKTISGGWKQACIEMSNAGMNWKGNFTSLLNSFETGFASAFKKALTTAKGVFDAIDKFATSLFQSILQAFLDLIAKIVAKLAIYGILNLFTGGTGGIVGKLFGFAEGGLVPGAAGQAVPAIVHGGEYVLPASIVSAIRSGMAPSGAMRGGGLAFAGAGGGISVSLNAPITINGGLGSDSDVRSVCEQLTSAMKTGVSWAIENAKTSYKVGARHDGESA
ncbi:MAG: hypothetical protein PHP45_04735 [Elusimicrobiales bacterium]|nr:hypothetical protein [Elusimicrobiales bacterium]